MQHRDIHVTTTQNVTNILLIVCQSYIPDKALTLASNSMTPANILGLLVHVKILKVYESLMKFTSPNNSTYFFERRVLYIITLYPYYLIV